ncbi:TonB-dependent receptor [Caulobacter sp. 17J65-9]|uniref:TonB-dependent receptor n=1 Tax=Caulobacter sp. 17J65-9 TaxID=2709382 RepID=UPI0013C8FD7D|nr:TonB-dependent receptor [Caulobacter sp. 17J65-9]NEX93446.1 TonB-dependent receptor [Caulobacter sp. 17J65-9]
MRIRKILLGSVASLALLPTAALAETASADTAATDTGDTVQEIVVTARKREEKLQEVPIAVTAVSGETLERQQVITVKDVAAFAPGLTINSDAVGRAFVSIRGIGTTLIDTVQPGVGIFIDGIYQPNTSYLNSPTLDVAQIEVLRGPQGTLFGNNTLGGAINVISRAPTDELTGKITADYAGPDNYRSLSGVVSGALVEGKLRGRLAASYHAHDGFSENTLAGGDARPLEQHSLNGSLIWDPADGAQITLGAYYDQVQGSQTAYSSLSGPTDYVQDTALNVNSLATYDYWGANLKGVFDLGERTQMTAIAAYDDKKGRASGDGDYGPIDFLRTTDGRNSMKTVTGELRFDTHWSDRVSTLVGVFAQSSESKNSGVNTIVPFGISAPTSESSELSSAAVFGTVFWRMTDTLELAAGLRYDHQELSVSSAVADYDASELQPRVTLSQKWSPRNMTYASVSRGFRGGGANGPGAPNPIYQGDSVWSYEVGNKFTSADHKLILNVAAYYNDYSDYIGQNSLAPCTCGVGFVAINLNSGDVESYGAELEATWKATERFTLQGGATWNHTRITDGSQYEATTGMALASDRILFQPDWNFFTTASYVLPLGSDDLRFDGTLIGKGDRMGSTLSPTFQPEMEKYFLVNANVTWTHDDWTLGLFATNLFDEKYYETYLDQSLLAATGLPAPLVRNLGIAGDGRRVGVRLKYAF